MFIFLQDDKYYVYIHIPKNNGKTIRTSYKTNKNITIVKSYWGRNFKLNLDLAHIPYILKDAYIDSDIEYNYFTYTRNPYDRIISAYFYKNPNQNINDLKIFIKNVLSITVFSLEFHKDIIHYYPQYLFVCDNSLHISPNIHISKLETIKSYNLIDYFDNECIEIINKIYQNDFVLFDYSIIQTL